MKFLRGVIYVGILLLSASTRPLALDVQIGQSRLTLLPPQGYCDLELTRPAEAKLLSTIGQLVEGAGNRLLAVSVDCAELKELREGRRVLMDHFAQYQVPKAYEDIDIAEASVFTNQACSEQRANGQQMIQNLSPGISAATERALRGVKVNETKFLGIFGEDAANCYSAIVQKVITQVGSEKTQVAITATTVAKKKAIFFILYAPVVSGASAEEMFQQHRRNLDRFHAGNPN